MRQVKDLFFLVILAIMLLCQNAAAVEKITGSTKIITSLKDLRTAIRDVIPGDKILIEPGIYMGGFGARNINGTKENPIVIAGRDPDNPPVFSGRGEAVKLSSVSYIKIENLKINKFTGNGINIDDSGTNGENPSHHIVIDNITINDIGPKGNNDGIKLSGVDNFIIKNSRIEGWGGSGIDLVGTHFGIIQEVIFQGVQGFRTKNGLQIKGGSSEILVQGSSFINCGERAVCIGGSTGTKYFRPKSVDYEAKNIVVAGNRFVGGNAQVAWITAQDSYVHHNIFYLPEKFVGRILQETKDTRFKPCQNGVFEANLIVTDIRLRTFFNIGPNTLPESFTFLQNAWYSLASQEKPKLPTQEINGIYGVYPELKNFGTPQMEIESGSKELKDIGPKAYTPWKTKTDFEDIKIPELKKVSPGVASNGLINNSMQWLIIGALITMAFLIMVVRFVKNK